VVDEGPHAYWVILVSFVAAGVLVVLPLPDWLQWGRPEWVALTLIYWVIALPHRVGIFTAVLLGVGLDILEGAVLGQNAFALLVVAALCLNLYQRLRVFNLWQQAGLVFLLPAVSSAVLWPVVLQILRSLRRHYLVA